MKKKVLITGSKGFIGRVFLGFLDRSRFEILTIGRNKNEDLNFEFNSTSCASSFLKEKIVEFSPDVVFHFASGSSIMTADKNVNDEYEYACLGTDSLVKILTSLKVKPEKVVYLSSQAVYGIPLYLPVDELHPALPVTTYGENKLKTEKILINSGLRYIVLRVSSAYGPFQNSNKSGVIAKFINRILNNQSPVVFNDFDLLGDFIYVGDVADVLVKILCNGFTWINQICNLGFGRPVTLRSVLNILYKYFPDAQQPVLQTSKLYPSKEEKGIYLNIAKLQKLLNWEPRFNLEEGLKLTLENALVKVSGDK